MKTTDEIMALVNGCVRDYMDAGQCLRQAIDPLQAQAADAQCAAICSDYANVQTNKVVRYQKRIRDLEKQVAQQVTVPLTEREMYAALVSVCNDGSAPSFPDFTTEANLIKYVRAIEAHHGIGMKS